jgi:hypothetical protein
MMLSKNDSHAVLTASELSKREEYRPKHVHSSPFETTRLHSCELPTIRSLRKTAFEVDCLTERPPDKVQASLKSRFESEARFVGALEHSHLTLFMFGCRSESTLRLFEVSRVQHSLPTSRQIYRATPSAARPQSLARLEKVGIRSGGGGGVNLGIRGDTAAKCNTCSLSKTKAARGFFVFCTRKIRGQDVNGRTFPSRSCG